jgi:hypothetical protein
MKTFAVVNENNIIENIVISETALQSNWIECTGENSAYIGASWNAQYQKFIGIKPYPSWVLNLNTYFWEAPIAKPTNSKSYYWNELTTSWDEVIDGNN